MKRSIIVTLIALLLQGCFGTPKLPSFYPEDVIYLGQIKVVTTTMFTKDLVVLYETDDGFESVNWYDQYDGIDYADIEYSFYPEPGSYIYASKRSLTTNTNSTLSIEYVTFPYKIHSAVKLEDALRVGSVDPEIIEEPQITQDEITEETIPVDTTAVDTVASE